MCIDFRRSAQVLYMQSLQSLCEGLFKAVVACEEERRLGHQHVQRIDQVLGSDRIR